MDTREARTLGMSDDDYSDHEAIRCVDCKVCYGAWSPQEVVEAKLSSALGEAAELELDNPGTTAVFICTDGDGTETIETCVDDVRAAMDARVLALEGGEEVCFCFGGDVAPGFVSNA